MTTPAVAPPTLTLLAMPAEGRKRFERVLKGHRLVAVERMAEALAEVKAKPYGMIVVDAYFDDSQMFELIELIRAGELNRTTPILCFLAGTEHLSHVLIRGMDQAVKALMANAFIDLRKMPDDEAGNGRLRRIVDYLILIDGDMHSGA